MTDSKALNTAIHTLEYALHPATSETEIVAAVLGWRRKMRGQNLETVCRSLWDKRTSDGMGLVEYQLEWADRFNALQERVDVSIGETVELRQQLASAQSELRQQLQEANTALIASQKDNKTLRLQLGKRIASGGLPSIIDPDAPPQEKTPPLYPLGQTDLVNIEFGDLSYPNPGWNGAKRFVAAALIAEGVPIADICACMNGIVSGPTEAKNYKFHEDVGLSIKNENATEIYRGLKRAASTFDRRLRIIVDSNDKVARTDGKAGGRYSRGSAFPGDRLTLEVRPVPPPDADETPAPLLSLSQ